MNTPSKISPKMQRLAHEAATVRSDADAWRKRWDKWDDARKEIVSLRFLRRLDIALIDALKKGQRFLKPGRLPRGFKASGITILPKGWDKGPMPTPEPWHTTWIRPR